MMQSKTMFNVQARDNNMFSGTVQKDILLLLLFPCLSTMGSHLVGQEKMCEKGFLGVAYCVHVNSLECPWKMLYKRKPLWNIDS